MIINGKVYVGTTTGVGVFGLLSDGAEGADAAPARGGANKVKATAAIEETNSALQRRAIP
jgi:hypothetical protein